MDTDNTQTFFARNKATIAIVGCMVLVTLLSVAFFLKQSLRLDEAQSLWQTSHSLAKMYNIIGQDVHVPLYHTILHYWQVFFGSRVPVARLLSLVFFILSIPALFRLTKLLYGEEAAIFAILLFSISPFMNWYGNEIRMYSLFTLMVILNLYYFIRIYKERDTPEQQGSAWVWYGVTALLGIYSHYFFFFALTSEVVLFLSHRSLFPSYALKRFLVIASIMIISFLPWIWYVMHLGTISNSSPLLQAPNSVNIFNTFSQFLFGFQIDYVNTILVSLWPVTVLLGFLALRTKRKLTVDTAFIIICFIAPNVCAFVVSSFVRPLYLSRYLILTLPPLYMLLSALAVSYPQNIKRIFMGVLIAVMLGTLTAEIVSSQTPVKENYKQVTDYLEATASPQDVVLVSAPFTVYPIDYYYNGPVAIYTLPVWDRSSYGAIPPFDAATLPEQVKKLTKNSRNVWVILSYDQGYEDIIHSYFDNNYQQLLVKNFSSNLNLYEYKVRY
ncbi:MAG: rane protein-like protein [Candidatus Nomurabacteria bacterium]|nr:rane protein-like protein [Candidatus Nomurabacteria bacterium]